MTAGEFDLLRRGRRGTSTERWARKTEREALNMYFKLKRAREEIRRLDLEARRLLTYIRDFELNTGQLIKDLTSRDPLIALQVQKRIRIRQRQNAVHLSRIRQLAQLDGFAGLLEFGTRVGSGDGGGDGNPRSRVSDRPSQLLNDNSSDEDSLSDFEMYEEVDTALDFMERQL